MSWTTEVRDDRAVFRDLASWWNRAPGPSDSPFLRAEWFELWTDAFLPDGARLEVVVVLHDGEPVGALPLGRRGAKRFSLSNAHSDVFDAVLDADPELGSAAATQLAEWLDRCPVTRFYGIDPASPLLASDAGSSWRSDGGREAPYLALPTSSDLVLSEMSRNRRSAVRRNERRLEELGDVTFVDQACAAESHIVDRCLELEAAGWKGSAGTAMNSQPDTERFYRALVTRADQLGLLRLSTLQLDDRLVAFQLCLQQADARHLLKLGFDEQLSECSPGNVIQLKVLQAAVDQGVTRFEFGGESEEWKLRWTTTSRPRRNLLAFGRRGSARLLGPAARVAARLR